MGEVGCPEGDAPVLVAEMDDGVVQVLGHGVACAEFGAVFDDELAGGGVLVFEVAWVALEKRKMMLGRRGRKEEGTYDGG